MTSSEAAEHFLEVAAEIKAAHPLLLGCEARCRRSFRTTALQDDYGGCSRLISHWPGAGNHGPHYGLPEPLIPGATGNIKPLGGDYRRQKPAWRDPLQ